MKRDIELEATLVAKYAAVGPVLDERSRRRWAAAESFAISYGGDAVVSSTTGVARETIRKGRPSLSTRLTASARGRGLQPRHIIPWSQAIASTAVGSGADDDGA